MAIVTASAAVSHVGKVRSNNQDSGFAGETLFAVADGMGGHAGGDVASALALKRLAEIDGPYGSAVDAEFALQEAIVAANAVLTEAVYEHPELTGMGTTLSALVRVGHSVALAHIGDSRVYRLRDDVLTQITVDHTFVQRLVDSGRITAEEAKTHPRRSVLMRVLGDVDAAPEVDLQVMDTRPGDRWMLCSDGLSGVVEHDDIAAILRNTITPKDAANALVRASLDHGAPDNVTVVVVDVHQSFETPEVEPVTVGSAARPIAFEQPAGRRSSRIPGLRLHPRNPTSEPSHFEPESDDYLDELIEEDRRRSRRRKVTWLVGTLVVLALIAGGLYAGYRWTQTRFYVGESQGTVAIFQGVQQGVGPLQLSHVYQLTDIAVDDLPAYTRRQVENTISTDSAAAAQQVVERLSTSAGSGAGDSGGSTATPTPTPTGTPAPSPEPTP
ncbi:protein phosphatase 2C domain-containing protein [Herbiconiux moechotypicola]|uniref:Protein phosphatase 2C domain-containing protein n=1 Tax=Herbiconiux moechotypicola TaxID=637393 RepID=A0ABN3DB77_9MICO|nr:PP2C family serine/threonine-protein phosphatase [Herbiconiux moechotypicola]MCS5728877.1 protein phosphatase 2C domain-containing protein [Herbiconiux moechotypicola]